MYAIPFYGGLITCIKDQKICVWSKHNYAQFDMTFILWNEIFELFSSCPGLYWASNKGVFCPFNY